MLPGKDAKPEDWKAYYKAIDAPDAAALEPSLGEVVDKAFATKAAATMAEAGLLPHQAKALAEWWNTESKAALEAHQTAATKAATDAATAVQTKIDGEDAALKNEWGDKYPAQIETAKRAVRQFLPSDPKLAGDAITALERSIGYGATMKMLQKIGAGLAEGTLRGDGQPQNNADANTEAARAKRLYPTSN